MSWSRCRHRAGDIKNIDAPGRSHAVRNLKVLSLCRQLFVLCLLVAVTALLALWQIDELQSSNRLIEANNIRIARQQIDFSRLIDMTDFKFKIFENFCRESNPFLLILVTTAPGNFQRRKTIRDTWGRNTDQVKTAFLLGAVRTTDSAFDMKAEEKLISEHQHHGDLLQGSFVDSYKNLTYKHVMALKYVTYSCPNVSYVLKVDDDAFVNIDPLLSLMREKLNAENVMFCKVAMAYRVTRDPMSERSVSVDEYAGVKFPPYCWGFAIVYSPDVMAKLYRTAQKTNYFWIEDVYVTGILASRNHLEHKTASQHVFSAKDVPRIMKTPKMNAKFLLGYDLSDEVVRELWKRA